REVFSKLSRLMRGLRRIKWPPMTPAVSSRRLCRPTRPELKANGSEFRSHDGNVEAPATLAVEPALSASAADLGNAPHSCRALPLRLARPHPPLSRFPQSLSFCL